MFDLIAYGGARNCNRRFLRAIRRGEWIEGLNDLYLMIFSSRETIEEAKILGNRLNKTLCASEDSPVPAPDEPDKLYILLKLKSTKRGWKAQEQVISNRFKIRVKGKQIFRILCEVDNQDQVQEKFRELAPEAIRDFLRSKSKDFSGPSILTHFHRDTRLMVETSAPTL
jgi:hypothetical protein